MSRMKTGSYVKGVRRLCFMHCGLVFLFLLN